MEGLNAFVSVGSTATDQQESFVRAVEERLRSAGIIPHTVGRNTFSSDAPFKAINDLLDTCSGAVVIAFERVYFPSGFEKRGGPKQTTISEIKLPTPWNQIEAAMAYSRGLPLLIIVEDGLRIEGLLEKGNGWYVQSVKCEPAALNSAEFSGVLADWQRKMTQRLSAISKAQKNRSDTDISQLTVGQLINALKPAQLWSVLVALGALIASVFALGGKFLSK
jgi:hypothetical protein